MTTWTFTPPTVEEGPAGDDALFRRVKLTRGVSVLEGPPGTYRAVRYPWQGEIEQAVSHWLGGHEYAVDDATRAALIAAGIGVTADNFEAPDTGYGAGAYGAGPYGA